MLTSTSGSTALMYSHLGSGPSRLVRVLTVAIAAVSAFYLASFLLLASAHLFYPYEIDNMEGGLLAMVVRVLHDQSLYTPPSVDYTAFSYAPLYFHVAAWLMRLIGPGYAALRLVSLLATAASSSILYAVLRREGVRPSFAFAAVAVFVGAYARTHYVADAGRVDPLALALALGALAVAFTGAGTCRNAVLAGILGGLAILTKQPMAILIGAAVVFQLVRGPRARALVFAIATIATAAGVLAALGCLTDPWFYFFAIRVPASHHIRPWDLVVLGPVFLATTLPAVLAAPLIASRSLRSLPTNPWTVALLAYLPMALLARAKEGGSTNVFLPIVALAAIQLARSAEALRDRLPRAARALVAAQLALLAWSPLAIYPTAADVRRGDQLLAQIAAIPGDVYIPAFPAYAALAGKPWYAHYCALCDATRVDGRARAEVARQLAGRRFAAVLPVMDLPAAEADRCDISGLAARYRRATTLDIPAPPSDVAAVLGGPAVFARAHGGKLGDILTP